jgi:hypothetical protein
LQLFLLLVFILISIRRAIESSVTAPASWDLGRGPRSTTFYGLEETSDGHQDSTQRPGCWDVCWYGSAIAAEFECSCRQATKAEVKSTDWHPGHHRHSRRRGWSRMVKALSVSSSITPCCFAGILIADAKIDASQNPIGTNRSSALVGSIGRLLRSTALSSSQISR